MNALKTCKISSGDTCYESFTFKCCGSFYYEDTSRCIFNEGALRNSTSSIKLQYDLISFKLQEMHMYQPTKNESWFWKDKEKNPFASWK